jgi:hypothetical protein
MTQKTLHIKVTRGFVVAPGKAAAPDEVHELPEPFAREMIASGKALLHTPQAKPIEPPAPPAPPAAPTPAPVAESAAAKTKISLPPKAAPQPS